MKFIPYIWRNIVRNKPRFAMTFLSMFLPDMGVKLRFLKTEQ